MSLSQALNQFAQNLGRYLRSHCTVRRFSPAFNHINDLMRAVQCA